MPIPASILERVETFRRNHETYVAAGYTETELRREFLDPLFKALGWDIANEAGYAEMYKDVVHEDALKIGGDTKAPDYSFRIGGTRKFFVEAKKPGVRIKTDPAPAAQLRRYSWSAKLPLGIVTDFDEFAIYDTRIKPKQSDKAAVARIFYCTYEEYVERWDEIAAIFARESVLKGSFDKYAATNKGRRGTTEFDDAFLADMEHWRALLARNLALRNDALTQRDLNFAVQRILDRIIFLRIAEDRGIEPLGQLQALTAGGKIYPRLCEIFERADFRYNSGLFHFANEKGREESPDKLTLGLTIDDVVLKEIIRALYYPQSPYAFAVVPADILGHVYEQFLGKVINLTAGHQAKIEEKPEVRKAGGVYYTPTYIVDYIVKQTVGPLVEGKTPKQVEKLTVLDPACGSGSFLLGAFEYLLDWHLKYYLAHEPEKWAKRKNPPIYETAPNAKGLGKGDGNWQLTTAERKRILVNNLYGVDIDGQAVEVTKLSLLLKVLEGEARELQGKTQDFYRVLPDLGNNIKCGNSLIGSDFYQQPDLPEFDDEARIKLNVFDWDHEFKTIMAGGGFDAVIGNPPYVRPHHLESSDKDYFWSHYPTFTHKADLYCCFIEKAGQLLRSGGLLAFIVSHGWLRLNSFQELRRFFLKSFQIEELVELPFRVFRDAQVDTGIFVVRKGRAAKQHSIRIMRAVQHGELAEFTKVKDMPQATFQTTFQNVFDLSIEPETESVKEKMRMGICIGERFHISFGLKTGADSKFLHRVSGLNPEDKALLRGDNVKRYSVRYDGEFVWYVPEKMRAHRKTARPGEPRRFEQPKILVKDTSSDFGCTYDASHYYVKDVLIVVPKVEGTSQVSLKALCGILNSKLLKFYYRTTFPTLHVQSEELASLPLPLESSSKPRHDTLVAHVERMLKLHEDLAVAKSPDAQTRLQRDIAATDRAIDQLVYQLYGLTSEEIALVEAATTPAK
ncbi:MAG: TaqI-like C-terminal specificity domain-containing protein [Opitutaceae bacterium]